MDKIMEKFADFVIRHRLMVLCIIGAITLAFGWQMRKLTISTNFNELLPQDHEYIKIHNEFRTTFGGANFLVMMVSVKEGDIFNTKTLEKVRHITNELEKVPGVDRYKIISMASRKIKNPKITSWGMEATPLMWPEVPKTEQDMQKLKEAVYSNEAYYGSYVSFDAKKCLIFADFFEEELDYTKIKNDLDRLRLETEDENTTVSIVGHPMHLGVVASYIEMMNYIMIGTGILIPILLFIAYRSIMAAIFVPLAAVVSGIWGLGFYAYMGYNLDPLIFVMPFLISLMAFRHSHQLYNRYFEEYIKTRDPKACVRTIITQMFLPGVTSIVTDAFGIAIVAITPVPMLQHMAIAGAFWAFITVIIGLLMTPVLMSYVPVSAKFLAHIEREQKKDELRQGAANKFADWLGPWIIGHGRWWVFATVAAVMVVSYYYAETMIIGDAQVGSNLLYPSSRYNQDSVRINQNLPLINPLYVVLEGEKVRSLTNLEVMQDMKNFTAHMMRTSGSVGAQNIIGPLMAMPQKFHEDDPKWAGLSEDPSTANTYLIGLTQSGDPGDMNKYLDPKLRQTNIALYYMDKTGPTIQKAIASAKEYIEKYAKLPEGFKYKLCGGVIGTEAAINEMVARKQLETLLYALLGVLICVTIEFRSIKAGLILTIPLLLSNYMAFAYMAINGIGLSISTLPVSASGIGMGVDYGIYLLARCAEEKSRASGISMETALLRTITSYSKSIIYIAGTLVLGLLVWALSPLKFQA
ncbi:MAG: MMPL family transporter, partial [Deltaproteobacteria bacterium]|nr:MMPL family transporter [Deltaproteobacteria bacterium]